MMETLKKNWFVCLIAVLLVGFLGYYIVDLGKDNVSSKSSDNQDVLASTDLGDITSEEIYDAFEDYSSSLLYALYRNSVVDQAVATTSEMESNAKTFKKNVESNLNADSTGATKVNIISELASYGYDGIDHLYDYCLMTLKQEALDREYVDENFDELKDSVTSAPRTVSILTMEVADPDNLTEEEMEKQQNIELEIEEKGFESAVAAYSDDLETVAKDGFFGYIDAASTDLDSSVVEAAIVLDKGQVSDWITVTDSDTGTTMLYKVKANETDLRTLFDDEDEDIRNSVLEAFKSADSLLEMKAVQSRAGNFEISYASDEIREKVETYISDRLDVDEEELDEAEEDGVEVEVTDNEEEANSDQTSEETEAQEEVTEESEDIDE